MTGSAEGIGARVTRREDKRFITGKGRYTDDMAVAGMCHAAFVRSPHAHAKVTSLDADAARAMPGVIAVLTGEELAADGVGNLIQRREEDFTYAAEYVSVSGSVGWTPASGAIGNLNAKTTLFQPDRKETSKLFPVNGPEGRRLTSAKVGRETA